MSALLTVILSFAGALVAALLPAGRPALVRWWALLVAAGGLAASFLVYLCYDVRAAGLQQVVHLPWVPELGISFKTGVDGITLPLLLVTGLVAVCGVLFSWKVAHRPNAFFATYLALVGGVYGVFLSADLFLLFVFYEIAIVPKYLLIAIWGGTRKSYAAMKLVLYSFLGSALVLLGIIAVYRSSGTGSLDLAVLMAEGQFSHGFQVLVFPLIFVGFAVLAGMWPFHSWAPTGHVAAPTAASMLLAGVVMKLGAYGCLRGAVALFPEGAHAWAPWIAWIAVINILYGAFAALAQNDFKFVIGYSSVSHMGFVLLGLATLNEVGLAGAVLQMFSHGVIGALLFAIVGTVVYSRTGTRRLDAFDRLVLHMPAVAWIFVVAGLASMGLPGFSGFVAEIHVIIGAWAQERISAWVVVLTGAGILLTFGYTLVKVHEAFFRPRPSGPAAGSTAGESDGPAVANPPPYPPLTLPEIVGCGLLGGTALLIGIFPGLLTDALLPSLAPIVERLGAAAL